MKFVWWNKKHWKRELTLIVILLLLCYALWYMIGKYNESVDTYHELGKIYTITNEAKRCKTFFIQNNNIYCEMVDGTIFGGPLKTTYHVFNTYVNAMAMIAVADEKRREGKLNQLHFDIILKYLLESVYSEPENTKLITKPDTVSPSPHP